MKVLALIFVTILSVSANAETSFIEEMNPSALASVLAGSMGADRIEISSLQKEVFNWRAYLDRTVRETARFQIEFKATLEKYQFELSCTIKELGSYEGKSRGWVDWVEIDGTQCKITSAGQESSLLRMIGAGFTVHQNPVRPMLVSIPRATLVLVQRRYEKVFSHHSLL